MDVHCASQVGHWAENMQRTALRLTACRTAILPSDQLDVPRTPADEMGRGHRMDAQLQSDGHASPVSLIGYPWTRCHKLQMDVQHGSKEVLLNKLIHNHSMTA